MDFKCPICLELFTDPQEVSCCHNIFCKTCISGISACPMCRSPIDATKFQPNIPIQRMANELRASGKESLLDEPNDIRFLAETNSLIQTNYAPYATNGLSVQLSHHPCTYCRAIATNKCYNCSTLICIQHSFEVEDGISKYSKKRTFCLTCSEQEADCGCCRTPQWCLWAFAALHGGKSRGSRGPGETHTSYDCDNKNSARAKMNGLRIQVFLREAVFLRNQRLDMFGTPTDIIIEKQKEFLPFLNVPWALRLCVDAMIIKGLTLEGIFRVPGNHLQVQQICDMLSQGNGCKSLLRFVPFLHFLIELGQVPPIDTYDIADISGVFKKFLREIPDPIFSDEAPNNPLERAFNDIADCVLTALVQTLNSIVENQQEIAIRLAGLAHKLAPHKRAIGKEMFFILHLVSLRADLNLMNSQNLATIFGGMMEVLSHRISAEKRVKICRAAIDHYDLIFGSLDSLKAEPPDNDNGKPVIVPIHIFLDNATYKSIPCHTRDTTLTISPKIKSKITITDLDPEKFRLWEIRDRDFRLIGDNERIWSLVERGSGLIFSGFLDPNEPQYPIREFLDMTSGLIGEKIESALLEVIRCHSVIFPAQSPPHPSPKMAYIVMNADESTYDSGVKPTVTHLPWNYVLEMHKSREANK